MSCPEPSRTSRPSGSVFRNAAWLATIQVSNGAFPLILLGYLTGTLGLAQYGTVAVGLAISQFAAVWTDFGYVVSGPAWIAKVRDHPCELNRVVSRMLAGKALLCIPCAAAIGAFALFESGPTTERTYFLLLIWPLIATAFQPLWFFQGMESLRSVMLATLAGKASYLVLTILWVKGPEDLPLVAVAQGVSSTGVLVIVMKLMRDLGLRFTVPGATEVMACLRAALPFFWSRVSSVAYNNGGVLYLGLVGTGTQAAALSIGQQFYVGLQLASMSLVQSLYPHMARTRDLALLRRVVTGVVAFTTLVALIGTSCLALVLAQPWAEQFRPAEAILHVYLLSLVVVSASAVMGYPYFVAIDRIKVANATIVGGGAAYLVCLGIFAVLGWHSPLGLAYTLLLVETGVLASRLIFVRHFHKKALDSPAVPQT